MISRLPNKKFWKNKKVLITGHSGFKGSWLAIWLHSLGAKVSGISLPPTTSPNLYSLAEIENICNCKFIDICNLEALKTEIGHIQPDIIIHMAAQPLVRKSYKYPINTLSVNILGTANILECIRSCNSVKTAIMITTDKVYKNNEDGRSYIESDPLGGHDPYSASKSAAELVIDSYRKSFFNEANVSISSARAGNVIGGGDWSEDRLIPDVIRSWNNNSIIEIRSPHAIRPWQHVLEPLAGYLFLAEDTYSNLELCSSYNFGPYKKDIASVKDVLDMAKIIIKDLEIKYQIKQVGLHEAKLLSLDISKSESILNFKPRWSIKESVKKTIEWYQCLDKGDSALSLCKLDIAEFEKVSQSDLSRS